MIRATLVLLATLLPASAETARVLTGEHGDFTRLVIELPDTGGWTLGRTALGYAFATKTEAQPDYNLDLVWQRIDRSRLAELTANPGNGALDLALACDCHIFPFEYQPGIVVLDIKPGPAPDGSAFEAAFLPPGSAVPKDHPEGRSYDWLAHAGDAPARPAPSLPLPLETGAVSLKPLRDELLEQIARGAADGIVDMELPGKPAQMPGVDGATPWTNVRIGEEPGVVVTKPNGLIADPGPNAACAAPDLLDLPSWGGDRPTHDLLAEARDGLFGEFDVPQEEAVLHSVRLLLYLGFGAEAGQTATYLDPSAAGEKLPLYRSMARLIDGESDPQTPFAEMLDCPGPAALWAALARDRLPPGTGVNRDAILQAFQALPAHLRSFLGPALAEKFLARNDAEATRMIRDAMERAPDADQAAVALLDAQAELHSGDAGAALAHAEEALALDGGKVESLIALVESHFRKLDPIDPGVAEALLSLQGENAGSEQSPEIARAIVLALALSDQTDAAFEQGPLTGGTEADLWRVIQARATDDDFLRHAVLAQGSARPGVSSDVALATGQRLLALGFPDAALVWLGPVTPTDAPELRLVAASAEAARGKDQTASDLLEGLQGSDAEALRAKVLSRLGDLTAAGAALAAAGDTEAATRLQLWGEDWTALAPEVPAVWQQAAAYTKPAVDDPASGLLDRGGKTVDASLASRDAIEALLSSVPSPAAN